METEAQPPRPTLRQLDITRAVRAAMTAGLQVDRIEIEGGKLTLFTSSAMPPPKESDAWADFR